MLAVGTKRAWTRADQRLIDEANSLLNGPPFTYGHVVVDEAQDHSVVALRVIGRWSEVFAHLGPAGSNGIVVDLTFGYRVPEPILRTANRLLDVAITRAVQQVEFVTDAPAPAVIAPDRSA